jgi:4-amino-4-deoxy-L-arabinose transferase-like glycosyltransferase
MKDKIEFLLLLLLYVLVILIAQANILQNDEGRYVMFAQNLSQGYYSPLDSINLWSGPGYPLVLVPFVLLKLDWLAARILNAFFLFLAIIYFYSTLKIYINKKYALYVSFVLGLYPPLLRDLHMLLTETFLYFLICGFIYHFCKFIQKDTRDGLQLILASLYLALIALTKIIFGYVILTIIVIFLIIYALKRKKEIGKVLSVQVIALLLCLPYLLYTYSLTGKIFYWGNSGGMSLYWMSTPYPGELGNWWNWNQVYEEPQLYKNHHAFFDNISKLDGVRQDEEFRKQALKNIREHPKKYLYNWMCNIGRLLFSYPFSYTMHSPTTFFYLIPNMFIIVLSILCVFPAIIKYKSIPFEIITLLLIFAIYCGGSSLISAYERQLRPVFPILFLWISFTLFRVVEIKLRDINYR